MVPGGEAVTLRIRIIGKPDRSAPDRPLKYVFALQATPLKPIGKDGWESRFGSCPWYGDDYDLLDEPRVPRQTRAGPLAGTRRANADRLELDARAGLSVAAGAGRADFKALVRACHARGIRVIPYLGYQISEKAPEYAQVRDEVVVFPVMANADKYPKTKPHMVSAVCLRSVWQDSLAELRRPDDRRVRHRRRLRRQREHAVALHERLARMRGPAIGRHGGPGLSGVRRPRHVPPALRGRQGQEGRRHHRQPRLRLHEPRGAGLLDELLDRRAALVPPTSRPTRCRWTGSARSSWA